MICQTTAEDYQAEEVPCSPSPITPAKWWVNSQTPIWSLIRNMLSGFSNCVELLSGSFKTSNMVNSPGKLTFPNLFLPDHRHPANPRQMHWPSARTTTTAINCLSMLFERTDEIVLPAIYKYVAASFSATLTELGYLTLARSLAQALFSPLGGLLGGFASFLLTTL